MPDINDQPTTLASGPAADTTVHQAPPEPAAAAPVRISMPYAQEVPDPAALPTDISPIDPIAPEPAPADTPSADAANTMPTVNSNAPAETPKPLTASPAKPRRALPLIAGLTGVLLLAAGTGAYALSRNHTLRASDVHAALSATTSLEGDLNAITSFVGADYQSTAGSDDMAAVSSLQKRFDDAQKQYALLDTSPVQRNSTLHTRFAVVHSKWPAYSTFVRDELSDARAITPVMNDLTAHINQLTATPPATVAQLGGFLTSYKQIVDDTNTAVTQLHLSVAENQQTVATLHTFLSQSSASIAAGQRDLAAGNTTAVTADLTAVQTASQSMSAKMSQLEDSIASKQKQLDPFDALSTFHKALAAQTSN